MRAIIYLHWMGKQASKQKNARAARVNQRNENQNEQSAEHVWMYGLDLRLLGWFVLSARSFIYPYRLRLFTYFPGLGCGTRHNMQLILSFD